MPFFNASDGVNENYELINVRNTTMKSYIFSCCPYGSESKETEARSEWRTWQYYSQVDGKVRNWDEANTLDLSALVVKTKEHWEHLTKEFPGGSVGKASACNAGDLGSISGSGRFPGEGNVNPLQYSCLGISWTREPVGLWFVGLQE